ncbi:MAG: undecaprenyl-diphosphate phosphatase [Chlamydiota bacterium]
MSILHAMLLGLLQGITEFFPVSSSAHLKIVKLLFEIAPSESQVVFDLVCHLGTLTALLFFLKREVFKLTKEQLKGFFFALLPLVPAYFLLKPLRDMANKPELLGFCLITTGVILFCGNTLRFTRKSTQSKSDLFVIGAVQSLALIPGISRSASTISCARILGWNPKEAVRFSFLLAIPTIVGGNCLELLKIALSKEELGSISFSNCLVGFLFSCGIGLITVRFGFSLLERGCFKPFAWYCLILGTLLSIYFYG